MNDADRYPSESRLVSPPNAPPPEAGGAEIRHFKLFDAPTGSGEWLRCRTCDGDGTNESTELIYVALPWMLRRSSTHQKSRNFISYTFTSTTQRTASKSGVTQTEVRVIESVVGDVILAARTSSPTGVEDPDGLPIHWEALIDGRTWARKNND